MTEQHDPNTELSFSRIETSECPFLYKTTYIDKIRFPEAPSASLGTLVHGALEHYWKAESNGKGILIRDALIEFSKADIKANINSNTFNDALALLEVYIKKNYPKHKVIGLEHEFHLILPNGVPITGKIDRVDEWQNGTIEVIDYKTNSWPFDDNDIEHSLQLRMYAIVASFLYPGKKTQCTYDFIRWGRKSVMFTDQELKDTMDYLEVVYDRIMNDTEFNPRPNDKCKFCKIIEQCQAMKDIYESGHIFNATSMTNDELFETYLKVSAVAGNFAKQQDHIKSELRNRISQSVRGMIETDSFIAKMDQRGSAKVPASNVFMNLRSFGLTPENIDRIMTVNKSQLLKLTKSSAKKDADALSVTVPGFPYVAIERKGKHV